MALRAVPSQGGRSLIAHGIRRSGCGAAGALVRRSSNSSRSGGACGGGEESSSRSGTPTCTLTCAPVHTAAPSRGGLIMPPPLPLGLPPRQYLLGETDFGMQEQISSYTSQQAQMMGLLTIDDILADFNRVTLSNQRKAQKAAASAVTPECGAAPAVEIKLAPCEDSAAPDVAAVQASDCTSQPRRIKRKLSLQRRRSKGRASF
eukprot:TRINITY_DN3395_c0_g1_i3.p1 TRINITY_DN3395_c0_g1~~TRINITY_DN3395_c0_g1_i3.p1  ORF type:complete len:204 (+),score=9.07 TRINITY_DN3395_c0_g1_i3:156-767(+)